MELHREGPQGLEIIRRYCLLVITTGICAGDTGTVDGLCCYCLVLQGSGFIGLDVTSLLVYSKHK